MKKYLTDLKMSQRLQEAGINRDSEFVWLRRSCYRFADWAIYKRSDCKIEDIFYPAYLLLDLLGMVDEDWGIHYYQKDFKPSFYICPERWAHNKIFEANDIMSAVVDAILWQKSQGNK